MKLYDEMPTRLLAEYKVMDYKQNYKSLTMVSCGIFETRISAIFFVKNLAPYVM